MQRCRQFLEGLKHFKLVVDHKPLIPILNEYTLNKLDNPRLLRLRMKMQRYSFTAPWIPGKDNVEADAFSRAPCDAPGSDDELSEGPLSFAARSVLLATINGSDKKVLDPVLEKNKNNSSGRSSDAGTKNNVLFGMSGSA